MSKAVKVMSKRAVVAAVQLTGVSDLEFESSLSELRELAKTLGFEVVGTFTQKRTNFDSTAYLGTGKRDEDGKIIPFVVKVGDKVLHRHFKTAR
jgi:GTP-binding protein HflX